jgi:hypothetical protein
MQYIEIQLETQWWPLEPYTFHSFHRQNRYSALRAFIRRLLDKKALLLWIIPASFLQSGKLCWRNWILQGLFTTPTLLHRLYFVARRRHHHWILRGIRMVFGRNWDTYVTLTYTNPDGTTGGLSDYYKGTWVLPTLLARQAATAGAMVITTTCGRMPRAPACTNTSTSTWAEAWAYTNCSGALTVLAKPTQAGGYYSKHYRRRGNECQSSDYNDLFWLVYFGSFRFLHLQ